MKPYEKYALIPSYKVTLEDWSGIPSEEVEDRLTFGYFGYS